ncbi:MAG: hypothetical protein ACF8TS_20805 [Maioricimonas sp. JB049]
MPQNRLLTYCDSPVCLFDRLPGAADRKQMLRIAMSLDELLARILVKRFVNDPALGESLVYQKDAPLECFWSRIELAYALGLIARRLRNSLHALCRLSEQIVLGLRPETPGPAASGQGLRKGLKKCRCSSVDNSGEAVVRVQLLLEVSLICAELFVLEKQVVRCAEKIEFTGNSTRLRGSVSLAVLSHF